MHPNNRLKLLRRHIFLAAISVALHFSNIVLVSNRYCCNDLLISSSKFYDLISSRKLFCLCDWRCVKLYLWIVANVWRSTRKKRFSWKMLTIYILFLISMPIYMVCLPRGSLTLSARQTKIDSFANSVDPDETARWAVSSGATLFAVLFLILDCNVYLHQWTCPNSRTEESTTETHGWKG